MSDEISYTANLQVSNSIVSAEQLGRVRKADQTGNLIITSVIELSTSDELIPLGEISTPRWAYFENADTTNDINLKTNVAGDTFATLSPGDTCVLPLGTTTPAAASAAGTPKLVFTIAED